VGNRTSLTTNLAVYGTAQYGTDAYGAGTNSYFTAQFNARNQMESIADRLTNETLFGYDADGRLAEVDHGNGTPALKTRHRYDLVGKLLETRVTQDTDSLWTLSYGYNLSADRLWQNSVWPGEGNSYRYELDASGRLIRETINRFVTASIDDWARGELRWTGFDDRATLTLVARDDSFVADRLDLQRWDLAITDPATTQVQIRPGKGLHWATSRGDTQRSGRVLPKGTTQLSSHIYDYPYYEHNASDNIGYLNGRMLMRHRVPLNGAFDVQVSLSEWQTSQGQIGLGVTRERFSTGPAGNKYPNSMGAIHANGCDIVADYDLSYNKNRVIFNGHILSDVTATRLRLRRYLDGSTWMLEGLYWDGDEWLSHANFDDEFDGQTMYAYLHLSGYCGHVRWSDFQETVGTQYLVSTVDGSESVNQAAWPMVESQTYDAGHSVDWDQLSWTESLPTNTDVRLQLATSEDPDGPWSYAGPSGANSYYSTAAGHTLSGLTGRYCRFRAFLYSTDGADTPELSNVHLSHSGTSASRMTSYEYDDAGNLLEIVVTDDSGSTTETRTVNEKNQIETITGGWVLTYDDNGCLKEKNNGTGVGDEKWEFTWDFGDDRLLQVKKGVYAAGPVLVNEFTVDYTYDFWGRMLTRDNGTDITTFVWDGWDLLSETTDSVTTDYLVPNGLIHSFLRDGDLYVVHCDGLGSCRMVTDSDGEVVAQLEYGPWGELLDGSVDSVPGGMSYGFVGGLGVRTDATTGLIYMRNRWFSGSLHGFISRDALMSPNRYSYAANIPTDLIDTNGLEPTRPVIVIPSVQTGVHPVHQVVPNGQGSTTRLSTGRGTSGGIPSYQAGPAPRAVVDANTEALMKGASPEGFYAWKMRQEALQRGGYDVPAGLSKAPQAFDPRRHPHVMPWPDAYTDYIRETLHKDKRPGRGDYTRTLEDIIKGLEDCDGGDCKRKRLKCKGQALRVSSISGISRKLLFEACDYWFVQCLFGMGPFPAWPG
jgi:RHS repeat-associated protein